MLILKRTATDGTDTVRIGEFVVLKVVELGGTIVHCRVSGEGSEPIVSASEDDGAAPELVQMDDQGRFALARGRWIAMPSAGVMMRLLSGNRKQCRIGFSAPKDKVRILRAELIEPTR